MTELARSDRTVQELTRLLQQPQALVSYHLGKLRAGGLVAARRSSFDRRASYYTAVLTHVGEGLAAAGVALHPALAMGAQPSRPPARRRRRARVLFACTGNGARSQIAEALLQQVAGERMDVCSGGSRPKPVHPNAVRVLADRGIDISTRTSKPLAQFQQQQFDVVVTLCDVVREECPEFSTRAQAIHWSIPDPGGAEAGLRATLPVFRALADDLAVRVGFLVALIDDLPLSPIHPPNRSTRHHARS